MNRHRAIAAALALAVVLPACASQSTPSAAPPAATSAAQPETNAHVAVVNIAFEPESLKVLRGTEVTWVNRDANVRHTATSGIGGDNGVPGVSEPAPNEPDGLFDGDLPDAGSEFSFTFDEAGTYAYFCEIHPSMIAEIVVE